VIIDESTYLEHFGKKGMKWGVRQTRKAQGRVDQFKRVAEGKGTGRDRRAVKAQTNFRDRKKSKGGIENAAKKRLDSLANSQAKMAVGKNKVSNMLMKLEGINMKDLDFSHS